MDESKCVCCGKIIPKDRIVCIRCECEEIKYGTILQSQDATAEEVEDTYKWLYERQGTI